MPLPHGRDISSENVELIVGREFPIKRFVSLCNSMIWAMSKPSGLLQASFTERVFVRDNGVDAEWTIERPGELPQGALLVRGWNVFQYKQRDVTGADRHQIIANLRRDLRRAACEVFKRTGNRPNHYSLFTNVDLTHDEKVSIASAVREGFDRPLEVTIRGAAEIAAAVNNLPHLRSAFFSTDRFSTWERAWGSHKMASVAGKLPDLVGRSEATSAITAAVDDPGIRVVAITGASGIGKNRLSLEATAHRPLDIIISLDSQLGVPDLLQTTSAGQDPIAIIDNPHPDRTRELITAAVADGPKLLITITDPATLQQFNFGQDPRVKIFALQPLSETESRDLLRGAGANLDYSVESWVIQKAGGNPSVLIAAAAVGQKLRVSGATFLDQVGDELEARARSLHGTGGVQVIRLLSILTAVGITGSVGHELKTICDIFGLTLNDVLSNVNPLARSGFVRRVGNYLEVVPPVLANRAATLGLAGREKELGALLSALPAPGRTRLLRRIQQLPGETLQAFITELFQHGALRDFRTALEDVQLLRLLAPAAPMETANLLQDGLSALSIEERLELAAGLRRDLVWTIEELLLRARTAGAALHCLRLLAEAENESFSNNATHIFEECFYPLHPQLPITLHDRLAAIRELANSDTKESNIMATRAGASAFNGNRVGYLRRSEGAEPFDEVPQMTYGEIYDYLQAVLEELRKLMRNPDVEVRTKAGEAFIQALGEFTVRARVDVGIKMLEEVAPLITAGSLPIRVEDYVGTLHFTSRGLSAQRPRSEEVLARVSKLIDEIEAGSFDIRVRRWVGTWDYGEPESDENGQPIFPGELKIRNLAQAAAADVNIIPEATLRWLCSREAKRANEFFFWLGKYDEVGRWEERIDATGEMSEGELAFAPYYGGRGQAAAARVEDKLDELLRAGRVRPESLLGATRYLPGSARAIARILTLLQRGLSPALAERHLMTGGWMKPLDTDQATTLLKAIAGHTLENAAEVIDFLAMWIQTKKPLEGDLAELAWQALESAPRGGEAWDFDLVASELAPSDPDRAFTLLEHFLTLPGDAKTWEPLDRHGGNRFWNTLWKTDRQRALELLFKLGVSSPLISWRISWHIPDVLDLEEDRDFLQQFARRDVHSAEFVSSVLTAAQTGFWPVALDLLSVYPENERVRRNIRAAASHTNHVIAGPFSEHYTRCAAAVEEILRSENLPNATRTFLSELAANLRTQAQRERRDEDDESVNW